MNGHPLLWPMACHVGLTALLYALLTIARAPAVWGPGRRSDGSNPWGDVEPRISANLSNQFEWPLFFHIACVLMIFLHVPADGAAMVFAWGFIVGRIAHSGVQILTRDVRLRGFVFAINFVCVLGLWGLLLGQAGRG